MKREYHRTPSRHVGRDMEMLVFGHAGARVLMFPPRMGRFFDYENWGMVERLRGSIEQGWIQLYCLDSLDAESLYDWGRRPSERIARHQQFERYVLDEVEPFTRLENSDPSLIAFGCSLGAYHAVNLAFRHPRRFAKVVAFSGRFDLTRGIAHYPDLFDGFYDDTVYFHTPSHFLANLQDPGELEALRRLEIALVVGRDDPVISNNRGLSETLFSKGIGHRFHEWDGEAHRPSAWRAMVPHFL
ncbi:MAG: alpha/beta hydrolase-fold protein [Isosphaeraceae bacterium]|nr:alpha/beta hydrolase-fold protein [Isosphaeraceae bacterium]